MEKEWIQLSQCKLYVNRTSNDHDSEAGVVLITSKGRMICYILKLGFQEKNNEAKFETLTAEHKMVKELEVKALHIFNDPQLLVCQVKEFQTKDTRLAITCQRY